MRGRKKGVALGSPLADSNGTPTGARAVTKPADLTPAASVEWDRIISQIPESVDLVPVDADALRQYCEAAAIRLRAIKESEGQSLVLITPNGAQQINPFQKIINQQDALMMKLSERFGFDPASRQRLKIQKKEANSPFMDYLKNGRSRRKNEESEAEESDGSEAEQTS